MMNTTNDPAMRALYILNNMAADFKLGIYSSQKAKQLLTDILNVMPLSDHEKTTHLAAMMQQWGEE